MERSALLALFDVLFFASIALWFLSIIVYGCLSEWFRRRLPRYDPALYESLSSPSFWSNKRRLRTYRFLSFLSGPQWKQLPDPTLVNICFALRVTVYLQAILILGVTSKSLPLGPHKMATTDCCRCWASRFGNRPQMTKPE